MSDLLPLVSAALRDKVLLDAKAEMDELNRRHDTSTSFEIIRDIVDYRQNAPEYIVHASGRFEDGKYGHRSNFWEVKFSPEEQTVCKLSDLRKCRVCVGGGFSVRELDDHDGFDSYLSDSDGACAITFDCNEFWLYTTINGWPKEEWGPLAGGPDGERGPGVRDPVGWDSQRAAEYLETTVARRYPEATVTFQKIMWHFDHLRGPLKRLLPKRRREESEEQLEVRRWLAGFNGFF